MKRKRFRDKRGKPEESFNTSHNNNNNNNNLNFYDSKETKRYTKAEQASGIQNELSLCALQMLQYHFSTGNDPKLILDIGIGAGACANVIQKLMPQYYIIGFDKSLEMLNMGKNNNNNNERSLPRDVLAYDFCNGLPFRKGSKFDAIISISALQWLCCNEKEDIPLNKFMKAITRLLIPNNGILIAQFYPIRPRDCGRFLKYGKKYNLNPEIIMDLPHKNKSKRYFLSLKMKNHSSPTSSCSTSTSSTSSSTTILSNDTNLNSPFSFCPCAWPNEAICALQLHRTRPSLDQSSEKEKHEWKNKMERLHNLHSKKMQQVLQNLWRKQDGSDNVKHRRINTTTTTNNNNNNNNSFKMFYSRRARIEAFLCESSEKANEKQLSLYYNDNPPLINLINDVENEIKYLSTLTCFQQCDLFLLRAKKKKNFL